MGALNLNKVWAVQKTRLLVGLGGDGLKFLTGGGRPARRCMSVTFSVYSRNSFKRLEFPTVQNKLSTLRSALAKSLSVFFA